MWAKINKSAGLWTSWKPKSLSLYNSNGYITDIKCSSLFCPQFPALCPKSQGRETWILLSSYSKGFLTYFIMVSRWNITYTQWKLLYIYFFLFLRKAFTTGIHTTYRNFNGFAVRQVWNCQAFVRSSSDFFRTNKLLTHTHKHTHNIMTHNRVSYIS